MLSHFDIFTLIILKRGEKNSQLSQKESGLHILIPASNRSEKASFGDETVRCNGN